MGQMKKSNTIEKQPVTIKITTPAEATVEQSKDEIVHHKEQEELPEFSHKATVRHKASKRKAPGHTTVFSRRRAKRTKRD